MSLKHAPRPTREFMAAQSASRKQGVQPLSAAQAAKARQRGVRASAKLARRKP